MPGAQGLRLKEAGTVRILVMRQTPPNRIQLILEGDYLYGWWKKALEFWAYDHVQPGVEMVRVGYQNEPERCTHVKGRQRRWGGDVRTSG